MRVLSALVLAHCFGCVFPEDSDEESTFRRPCNAILKKNMPDISATVASQERYCGHTKALFSNTDTGKFSKVHASHCKVRNTGNHDWVRSKVYVRKLTPPKSCLYSRFYATPRKFRGRRLLNRNKENAKQRGTIEKDEKEKKRPKNVRYFKSSALRKRKHYAEAKDDDDDDDYDNDDADNESDSEESWDNWSNWSTCSKTCGRGRQVRWRHCTVGKCVKGLKKAQIKSCRLKDCDKGILGWLGIKST